MLLSRLNCIWSHYLLCLYLSLLLLHTLQGCPLQQDSVPVSCREKPSPPRWANAILSHIPGVIVLSSPQHHSPTHPCISPLQEDASLILSTSAFTLLTWLDALLLTLFVFLKCFPVSEVQPHHLT